ncbi:manganese efflux pump MntP family protein [Henriciella sp.]|uniref:manganese efflux pump MntP n=1 Tax=Henriciella sp. TaxID=1968823 RepID=UPI0026039491|nr:manganese efflux pump MntP family protein [Henriciella sp.]
MSGLLTLVALAFSLSVDAFAAALGKGAGMKRVTLLDALKVGAVFGGMEAFMPLVGFAIGLALAAWVQPVDHWIAFVLLAGVGAHMLYEAVTDSVETHEENIEIAAPGLGMQGPKWIRLVLAALATSIDATVVGVSLAMMDVNIVMAVVIIFVITTTMAAIGVMLGRGAGRWLGRYAEAVGGVVLIAIGALILWQHLSAGI